VRQDADGGAGIHQEVDAGGVVLQEDHAAQRVETRWTQGAGAGGGAVVRFVAETAMVAAPGAVAAAAAVRGALTVMLLLLRSAVG